MLPEMPAKNSCPAIVFYIFSTVKRVRYETAEIFTMPVGL